MLYYGMLMNEEREWVIYKTAPTREEVAESLTALNNLGISRDRLKIVNATSRECNQHHFHLAYIKTSGEEVEVSVHMRKDRQQFLVACCMLVYGRLKDVEAVELRDVSHHVLHRMELGQILLPKKDESYPVECKPFPTPHFLATERKWTSVRN